MAIPKQLLEAIEARAARPHEMLSTPGLMYEDGARDFARELLGILEDDDMTKTLRKKDLKCSCGTDRHFKNHVGMLTYTTRDGKKVYSFYCPKCKVYGEVER